MDFSGSRSSQDKSIIYLEVLESSVKVNCSPILREEKKGISGTVLVLAVEVPMQVLDVGPSVRCRNPACRVISETEKKSETSKLLQKHSYNFPIQTKPSASIYIYKTDYLIHPVLSKLFLLMKLYIQLYSVSSIFP